MQEKYKKLIRLCVIIGAVYLVFRYLLPLFFPFLLAYAIAWMLKRPVRFLSDKLRIRPVVGGGLLLTLFLVVAGGGIIYGVKLLLQQFAAFVANYNYYTEEWYGYLEYFCGYCDSLFRLQNGSTFSLLNDSLDGILLFFREEIIPFLTKNSLKAAVSVTELVAGILITFVAVLLFLADTEGGKRRGKRRKTVESPEEKEKEKENINFLGKEWLEVRKELSGAGIAYVKTQTILIILVSLTCSIGFFVIGNPYALLFGVVVGIFDAFPILGSGMILVPWAVISFFRGKIFSGAVLLTLYGICQLFREYLEPKLLGGKIGIRPVYSLMAVSIGYELFGISGVFLGPIGLVLIKSLWKVSNEA